MEAAVVDGWVCSLLHLLEFIMKDSEEGQKFHGLFVVAAIVVEMMK